MDSFGGHSSSAREALLTGGAPGVLSSQLSRSVTDSAVCLRRPAGCHLQISGTPQAVEFTFCPHLTSQFAVCVLHLL
jgi:hypothetical protein